LPFGRVRPGGLMDCKISIIIPVWNEASVINRTLDHIFTLPYGGAVEIIVVDGHPEGKTINEIRQRRVDRMISEKGRANQMNAGARRAGGDVLLFLHADTMLPENALASIAGVIETGRHVGGAFDLGIESERMVFRLIERAASLRSRLTRIPYGDQAIFIRRDYFAEMNGFREIPIMEDMDIMRRIKKRGDAIHIIPARVKTSARRWEKEGILSCTLRNWMMAGLYLLGISPERLCRFYP